MTATDKEKAPQTGLQTQDNPQAKAAERFTQKVLSEFSSNAAGKLEITEFQRQLIQGYFIGITRALAVAEEARLRKNASNSDRRYDNNLAVIWTNVNLGDLALDIVHYARMGLDMMQDNHLVPVPFKNNKNQKYDITLMPGYNGIQYIAEKYAVEPPKAVTIELVYSTDKFRPIKKNKDNQVESYEFEIVNPFDRGEIVGGFGYIEYADPVKNRLIILSRREIEKRKPRHASSEFWGGPKTEWVDGKKTETQTDGWFEQMCLKTLKREVYSSKHIPRDPQKVDENYQHMRMREARYAELESQAEVAEFANAITIDTTIDFPDEEPEPESTPELIESPARPEPETKPEPETGRRSTRRRQTEQPPVEGPEF